MKKKDLINALAEFNDNDELAIDDFCAGYIPDIKRVCGKTQKHTALYCGYTPGHTGLCFSYSKCMEFKPDNLKK